MIEIYIDGSSKNNGTYNNYGGHGFIVLKDNQKIHSYTSVTRNVTNNQEELKSAIVALNWLRQNNLKEAVIYTDSQYVQKGITQWIIKWKKLNWSKSPAKKVEIKNEELWKLLDALNQELNVIFVWIKGHQKPIKGIKNWNNEIDKLINEDISYR